MLVLGIMFVLTSLVLAGWAYDRWERALPSDFTTKE